MTTRTGVGALLLALALPASLAAQSATAVLDGVVSDTTGTLIPHVELRVVGSARTVRADENGAFRLAGLAPGVVFLEARRVGFHPRRWRLTIPAGTHHIALMLSAAPLVLADVVVRERERRERRPAPRNANLEGFDLRRRSGAGVYYERDDITRSPARSLGDFLRTTPGLRVVPLPAGRTTLRSSRGGCSPRLYLDGSDFPIDVVGLEGVPLNDIEAIEVMRGPSEIMPVTQQPEPGCVAVFVWTRVR